MLDAPVRDRLQPVLSRVAGRLASAGITAGQLTATGFILGMAAAGAAALRWWWVALGLWVVSRVADGLDGAVARVGDGPTDLGAWLDIVADFAVYAAFVVGCAIAVPDARVALVVLLGTYSVNGATVLALSAAVSRRQATTGHEDERTFVMTRGLAEGTETIVAHSLLVALPASMAPIAWTFAAMVGVTILQRLALARHHLT